MLPVACGVPGAVIVPVEFCGTGDLDGKPVDACWFAVTVSESAVTLYVSEELVWLSVNGVVRSKLESGLRVTLRGPAQAFVGLVGRYGGNVLLSSVPLVSELPSVGSPVQDKCSAVESFVSPGPSVPGYCYLGGVSETAYTRVATNLGSYPSVGRVLDSGLIDPETRCDQYSHFVHVTSGGRDSISQVADRSVVVGGPPTEALRAEYKLLSKAMVNTLPDVCVVYLHGSDWVYDDQKVSESRFVRVDTVFDELTREYRRSVSMSTVGTAAIMAPVGVRVQHDGVTYGAEGVRVFAIFRGRVRVEFTPPQGAHQVQGEQLYLTLLSSYDSSIARRFIEAIPPTSTHARYIRETGASVLMCMPKSLEKEISVRSVSVVQIDDPLEDWRATNTIRYEGFSFSPGDSSVLGSSLEWSVLQSFRSTGGAYLRVADIAVMSEKGGPLMVFGEQLVKVVKLDDKAPVDWSCRRVTCVDEYCMDRGGPSGSDGEWSDAI